MSDAKPTTPAPETSGNPKETPPGDLPGAQYIGPLFLFPGWAQWKQESTFQKSQTVGWSAVTLNHWVPGLGIPQVAKALGLSTPKVVSAIPNKLALPLMWISAGTDTHDIIYTYQDTEQRSAKGLQLLTTTTFAAGPTIRVVGWGLSKAGVEAAGVQTAGKAAEKVLGPVGWGLMLGDWAAGEIDVLAHPGDYQGTGITGHVFNTGSSRLIQLKEDEIDARKRLMDADPAAFYCYRTPTERTAFPRLQEYKHLSNLVLSNPFQYHTSDPELVKLGQDIATYGVNVNSDALEKGINKLLQEHLAKKKAAEDSEYHWQFWRSNQAFQDQINVEDQYISSYQAALQEIQHIKGQGDAGHPYMGYREREQAWTTLQNNYTTWKAAHAESPQYTAYKAAHKDIYPELSDRFIDDLNALNAIYGLKASQTGDINKMNYSEYTGAPPEFITDNSVPGQAPVKRPMTVGDKLHDIVMRRNLAQITEMVDYASQVPGARSPAQILKDNKELADKLGLSKEQRDSLLITTPQQLENVLRNIRNADGTGYNITKDFGIPLPTVLDAFDVAFQQGGMKLAHDPEKGDVIVLTRPASLNLPGDSFNYDQLQQQLDQSAQKIPNLNNPANVAEVKRRNEVYKSSFVDDKIPEDLQPYLNYMQGMIYDGTAPTNPADLNALLEKIKACNDRVIQHPSLGTDMDTVYSEYGMTSQTDPHSKTYVIPLEAAMPFLSPERLAQLREKQKADSGKSASAADTHSAYQNFRSAVNGSPVIHSDTVANALPTPAQNNGDPKDPKDTKQPNGIG